jgi:hypothetical protein
MQMLLAADTFYVVTVAFFKISLGLFFMRVIVDQKQRTVIRWVVITFTTFSFGYFWFAVFQCGVPSGSHYWQRRLANQCSPLKFSLSLGYIHALLSAGSDFTFMCLPYPLLRDSQLKTREKWLVSGILVFGTV